MRAVEKKKAGKERWLRGGRGERGKKERGRRGDSDDREEGDAVEYSGKVLC